MHDIDRTLQEQEFADEFEYNQELQDDSDQEYESEVDQQLSYDFGYETDPGFNQEFDLEFLSDNQGEMPDSLEMELANDLLNISNEQELDLFLGKLVRRAGRAVGKFARSSAGRAVGGLLKNVAKKALPFAGKALGTFVGGPLGGVIGGKLGTMATTLFELDLEGMNPEDQQFEVAKAYVRFANSAMRQGASLARKNPGTPPRQIYRTAIRRSAQQYAPGLLSRASGMGGNQNRSPVRARKGTWVRKGKVVVLYDF